MHKLLRFVFVLVVLTLLESLVDACPDDALADATASPSPVYLGDDPTGLESGWINALQGISHFVDSDGNGYWIFTQTDVLRKVSVLDPLDKKSPGVAVSMPEELRTLGYSHFGDLDQYAGYLFIPVTGHQQYEYVGCRPNAWTCEPIYKTIPPPSPMIAIFSAAELRFLGATEFPSAPGSSQECNPQEDPHCVRQTEAGWLAISPSLDAGDPSTVLLYSSNNHLTPDDPNTALREDALFRYTVNIDLLGSSWTVGLSINFSDQLTLQETNGDPLQRVFHNMQGGTFSPQGELYLVNGLASHSAGDDNGGVHVFAPSGRLLLDSTNGSGYFNYEYHGGFASYQEPEGIDWWDLDTLPHARGSGQLHVIMVDHGNLWGHLNVIFGDDYGSHDYDLLVLKHYFIQRIGDLTEMAVHSISVDAAPNLCLDVQWGNSNKGTPVQIWDCNGTDAQLWVYDRHSGTIRNPAYNRCLDVRKRNAAPGTPVQIWDCNGTDAQRYTYEPATGVVQSVLGTVLDIQGGALQPGTPVWTAVRNDGPAQRWLTKMARTIAVAEAPHLCLDVQWGNPTPGTPVWIWECNGTDAQRWVYDRQYGEIRNPVYNMCLDVQWGNPEPGTPVWTWECTGSDAQRWTYDSTTGVLQNALGTVLDIQGAALQPGTPVWTAVQNGGPAQRWF